MGRPRLSYQPAGSDIVSSIFKTGWMRAGGVPHDHRTRNLHPQHRPAIMIEVAPGQFVNATVALALKLITPETAEAAGVSTKRKKAA